jgi:peroxiredoxin
LERTAEKTGTSLTLLYDEGYEISEAFDVVYQPNEKMRHAYNTRLNANLNKAHSDNSQRLPVPATFIIDQHGEVAWRHFNRNYKKRASAKQILEALDNLEKKHH